MQRELNWLRREAVEQGLVLTEEDLLAILNSLNKTKAALVHSRPDQTEGLEPPYPFRPIPAD
jgi:hypothetical protein